MNSGWSTCLKVGLVSASVLALELGLTRFFSVMFEYHYSFLLISIAVLGLGLGGLTVHAAGKKAASREAAVSRFAEWAPAWMSLSIVLLLFSLLFVPPFRSVPAAAVLSGIPFLFAGMTISSIFQRYPERSASLYASDLAGAAAGTVAALVIIRLGAVNLLLVLAFLSGLAALFSRTVGNRQSWKALLPAAPVPAIVVLLSLNLVTNVLGDVPFSRGALKEMGNMISSADGNAVTRETRWSSFGRTDLVEDPANPDEMAFFIDGTAGTVMRRYDGTYQDLVKPELITFPGFFPLELLERDEKDSMLVIGSGGGREVLAGLLAGVKNITAVEVNEDLVSLMKEYGGYNGKIYAGHDGVTVVADEGRNFIRSSKERFDIIMLSLPVTKTSRSPDGFALTENFLFTEESILDYLDHLTPEGRLVVVAHVDAEIYRLMFTTLSALEGRGIGTRAAMRQVYTVGPEHMLPVFVLKNSPFSPDETERVHERMHARGYSSESAFIPYIEQVVRKVPLEHGFSLKTEYMLNNNLYRLSRGEITPEGLLKLARRNFASVTDDRPFFYFFGFSLPVPVTGLLAISCIALLFGWLTGQRFGKTGTFGTSSRYLLLFTILGIAFMLAEIPLMQKYLLFLGRPAHSMSVLLVSILGGAAMGSAVGGRLARSRGTLFVLRWAALVSAVLIVLQTFSLDALLPLLSGASFSLRVAYAALLAAPLGFFLGIPFPMSLRLLGGSGLDAVIPRAWGVNGIASVIGSALSIALSMTGGFTLSLVTAALLYLFLFLFCGISSGMRLTNSGTAFHGGTRDRNR